MNKATPTESVRVSAKLKKLVKKHVDQVDRRYTIGGYIDTAIEEKLERDGVTTKKQKGDV